MDVSHDRPPPPPLGGLYKSESIRDVAESLGITYMSDPVASALASDVEYRIHQVIEEASRFMRHARRTTIYPSDIDNALRVLNIEPLYGYSVSNPPVFKRALPATSSASLGPVYYIEDEEIDFERVIREEKITLPKGVSWTAHWLAVEGVQPLVPENPPSIPKETGQAPLKNGQTNGVSALPSNLAPGMPGAQALTFSHPTTNANKLHSQHLVKQVLSRELQLYYTRLTSSLLPPSQSDPLKRAAALNSLRNDAGLQALLPYLVRWIGEGVANVLRDGFLTEENGQVVDVLLDVIAAVIANGTLFVEPYLHQLLPPILSALLHSHLPPPAAHASHLRILASHTLNRLLREYSTVYPSLSPRIMKTLLLALVAPGKTLGTREGAVRGLSGIGREAVRQGLIDGGGAKLIGAECASSPQDSLPLQEAVLGALSVVQMPSATPTPLDAENDGEIISQLRATLGDFFAEKLLGDRDWAIHALKGPEGMLPLP